MSTASSYIHGIRIQNEMCQSPGTTDPAVLAASDTGHWQFCLIPSRGLHVQRLNWVLTIWWELGVCSVLVCKPLFYTYLPFPPSLPAFLPPSFLPPFLLFSPSFKKLLYNTSYFEMIIDLQEIAKIVRRSTFFTQNSWEPWKLLHLSIVRVFLTHVLIQC